MLILFQEIDLDALSKVRSNHLKKFKNKMKDICFFHGLLKIILYLQVVTIDSIHNTVQILPTKTKPKKLLFIGSDGKK